MKKSLPWIQTDGQKIVTEEGKSILLRGMGLGGWLLPEGYMWKLTPPYDRPRNIEDLIIKTAGSEYADFFWNRYYRNYITVKDIATISAFGLNSVRLPLNCRTLFNCTGETISFNESVLEHLDNLISWCGEYGIYIILDMHAAPGGQTGANIDDSGADQPELYQNKIYADQCVKMWGLLAERYAGESVVGGYDLLNEPLPVKFNEYNPGIVPLYRRIRDEIRKYDSRHVLIVEGANWATDWSVFSEFIDNPLDSQYILQFHKYWNNPDVESIEPFIEYGEKLNIPVYMGEGGENNLDWYSGTFRMLERNRISWNFWSYKKMDCGNSPVSFPRPDGWDEFISAVCSGKNPGRQDAERVFNSLLSALSEKTCINEGVYDTLLRRVPLSVPAEFFEEGFSPVRRTPSAVFRKKENINIVFRDGHSGKVDYCRQNGEDQDEEQLLAVNLEDNSWVTYHFTNSEKKERNIAVTGEFSKGTVLQAEIGDFVREIQAGEGNPGVINFGSFLLGEGEHTLKIMVLAGKARLFRINIGREYDSDE